MIMMLAGRAQAQSVGIGTTTPAASAALEVAATSKGFLPPRMTQVQRDAIGAPAPGLTIYNTDSGHLNVWDGVRWTAALLDTEAPYAPAGQTFNYTGGPQTYTVPYGVTRVTVDALGASGQAGTAVPFPPGGKGARVQATLTVTPGEVLTIYVGGSEPNTFFLHRSDQRYPPLRGGGGYNGGGQGSLTPFGNNTLCIPPNTYCVTMGYRGGGGGATDIRRGGNALTDRVIVAGGGGGSIYGVAGGDAGLNGANGQTSQQGQGGSQTAGGANGTNGYPGTLGWGGEGANFVGRGASGGGGYYGGGGGGYSNGVSGSGGGGSSYTHPASATAVTVTSGANTGNGVVTITPTPALQYAAPALSGANIALPGSADGGVVFSSTPGLKTNSSQLFWDNTLNRLGVGISAPAFVLHTVGSIHSGGPGGELSFQDRADASKRFVWYATGDRATLWSSATGDQFTVTAGGKVGIGVTIPNQMLHVTGRMQLDNGVIQRGGATITSTSDLGLYSRVPGSWMRFVTNGAPIRFYSDDEIGNTPNVTIAANGRVGIGTDAPAVPLDVQGGASIGTYYFAYYNVFGPGSAGFSNSNQPDVTIRASGRVVGLEFNATSDRRLKTVIGPSDRAADLALLNRLRITDYTLRDRAQFGDRRFKKVIAQEVEEVFPQAVQRQTGFLPDVYAPASAVQAEGDSLVILTLPVGLTGAGATAGQRVKLIGPTGEVIATVARPESGGSRRVAVRGAKALAGAAQVFVFGLEHPDVRSVDYEALAMLNVSATQELARQVTELQRQNAAQQTQLHHLQRQAQQSAADHAALQTLQDQLARLLGEKVGGGGVSAR